MFWMHLFLMYLFSATAFASPATGTPQKNTSEQPTSSIDVENSIKDSQQRQSLDQTSVKPQLLVANLEDFDHTNTNSQTDFSTSQENENSIPENKIISVDQLSNFNPESDISTNKENEYTAPLGLVTSVEQLSDVQPTDWAFQALQSLVERSGCIVGYPDASFRGDRAITRYEFAAGLNACLERIQQLIPFQTADLITQEDLAVFPKQPENLAIELAEIKGRVDALEARTDILEGQQFSTTAKLSGQTVMYLADGSNASEKNNTALQYQLRLKLNTSFTGTDRLRVSINAGNPILLNTATEFPRGRFDGRTAETLLMFGNSRNEVGAGSIDYSFQVNKQLKGVVSVKSDDRIISGLISPISGLDVGPISSYARLNPILFPVNLRAGVGFQWHPTEWFDLDFFTGRETGSAANPFKGLFNGGYAVSTRFVLRLDSVYVSAFYIHSYSSERGIDAAAGSNASKVIGARPVAGDTYVAAVFYRFSSQFLLGSSAVFSNPRTLGSGTKGDANVVDYRVSLFSNVP